MINKQRIKKKSVRQNLKKYYKKKIKVNSKYTFFYQLYLIQKYYFKNIK